MRVLRAVVAGALCFALTFPAQAGNRKKQRAAPPPPKAEPTAPAESPNAAHLVLSTTAQRGYKVTVRTLAGDERTCPDAVTRLTPCVLTVAPGPVTVIYKNGTSTQVTLEAGNTEVTLKKDPWMLTLPGIIVMSAGLVLEIVGAAANNDALVVSGLLTMGAGAGVLLVGVAVPRDVLEVQHNEFTNVARAVPAMRGGAMGTLTFAF